MLKRVVQKIKQIPEALKATLVFAVASFATSGINYITTPIFTRLLTNAQYGTVAVYNSWYAIIRVFASMTLIFPGILNVGLYDHKENRWKYLSSMLGITTVCTAVLTVIFICFSAQIEQVLALPVSLIVLMLLTCFTQPATTFWTFKQRYEYRYRSTFVLTVGSAIMAQAVAVAAVILFSKSGAQKLDQVRLWSAGVVNISVGIALFIFICLKGRSFVDIPLWKKTVIVALPLIPHYLGSEILSSIDKIMIGRMVGDAEAGIYSLAAVISAIGVLLWRALNIMFGPYVNEKLGKRDFESIRQNVKPLLQMAGIMCVVAALAAPEIIAILATKDYMHGIYVVPPIAAGVFIHALYDTYSAVSFFHKKSINIMVATIVAAVSNFVLNYVFISKYDYLAAGYTTLVSNIILALMHRINIRIIEKKPVYDDKFSALMTLFVVIGCLASNMLYGTKLIRYICVCILLAAMCCLRKPFIHSLMEMKRN